MLRVDLLLCLVAEGDCGSLVFLPVEGADKPLNAEPDNADAHHGLQRQEDLVVLVNENAAVEPEECEMYDEDQAKGDH